MTHYSQCHKRLAVNGGTIAVDTVTFPEADTDIAAQWAWVLLLSECGSEREANTLRAFARGEISSEISVMREFLPKAASLGPHAQNRPLGSSQL